jgi:glycosyltransferase involved in cell wall biosynthesis
MPTISVIIPTYNRADLITRAVASVERQTHPPIEVIIVDDCSSDDIGRVVGEISCKIPIIFERLERNSGGGVARNVGIRRAKGDYVAFLDSDDEWEGEHLRTLTEHVRRREGTFVVASSALVSETGRVFPTRRFVQNRPLTEKLQFILTGNLAFQTSTLLMPRSTALQFMFDGGLRRHQDWDLIFRMIGQQIDLILLPDPTTIYHLRSDARVSRSTSVIPSLRFLARHRRAMSRKSVARFIALEIDARRANNFRAVRSLVRSLFIGGISTREFVFHLWRRMKTNFPQKL